MVFYLNPKNIKNIVILGKDIIIKYQNGKEIELNELSFDEQINIMENYNKKPIKI